MTTCDYDVIVIGAGIEGSSSAYNLAKKGKKVLLLEQFPLPHSRGSSHGQTRITRYAYPDAFYVHMMTDAFPMWNALSQESGEDLFLNVGVLGFLKKTSDNFKKVTGSLDAHNIPYDVLHADDIRRKYPAFKYGDDVVAVFDRSGGLLRADRALRAFQTVFKQMGGTIRDHCPVTSILPGEINKVITARGTFTAKNLVIAVGAWAGKFTKALGLNVPLQPIRITVTYWKPSQGTLPLHSVDALPCFLDSTVDGDFHTYGFPADEYPGLVKVCNHTGPAIEPDERDNIKNDWTLEGMREKMVMYPWLADKPSIKEYCMYTNTPDHHPYIDRHPKHPNVVFAIGFSGHGFKLAPAVGKAVTELVTGEAPSYNMKPFRLDRFNNLARL